MRFLGVLFALAAGLATAAPVTVTYVAAPEGVSDGQYFVSPYQLTIDGSTVFATCYDVVDSLTAGQTWQANELDLATAGFSGYFSPDLAGYKRVGYLYGQTSGANTNALKIGLQHAIWDVFGSTAANYAGHTHTAEEDQYIAQANAAAAGNYANFNFSNLLFLEQTGGVRAGTAGTAQGLIFSGPGTVPNAVGTPEPGTFALLGTGAALLGLGYKRRSRKIEAVV